MALTGVSSGHSQQEPASPGGLSLSVFGWIWLRHLLRHLGTVCVSWNCCSLGAVTDIVILSVLEAKCSQSGSQAISGEASFLVLSLTCGVFA